MNFFESITSIIQKHGTAFLQATTTTISITCISLAIAIVIGLLFAFFKVSNIFILKKIADIYIFLVRGLPLIVQIMFLYYGISSIIVLNDFTAGAIALGIHSGAYIAEIFRGPFSLLIEGNQKLPNHWGCRHH